RAGRERRRPRLGRQDRQVLLGSGQCRSRPMLVRTAMLGWSLGSVGKRGVSMIRPVLFLLVPVCVSVIAAAQSPEWKSVPGALDGAVRALEVFDDGNGPALFVGGVFGVPPTNGPSFLARWDGAALTPVAGGPDWHVYSLKSFDSGGDPALYVGGF